MSSGVGTVQRYNKRVGNDRQGHRNLLRGLHDWLFRHRHAQDDRPTPLKVDVDHPVYNHARHAPSSPKPGPTPQARSACFDAAPSDGAGTSLTGTSAQHLPHGLARIPCCRHTHSGGRTEQPTSTFCCGIGVCVCVWGGGPVKSRQIKFGRNTNQEEQSKV